MTLTMDIFATACAVAGVQTPASIDGVSFLPELRGEPSAVHRRDFYFVRREGGPAYGGKTIDALRRGDWKLLQDCPFKPLELYDLKTDPRETTDRAAKNPRIFNELSAALQKQIQRAGSVPWQAPQTSP
jgi:arylsulfatase A-like enzyme